MAVPEIYTNNVPVQNIGGLTPLQLAAANYMMTSTPQPFAINIDFLAEMVVFGSSENITPLEFDPRTGLPSPLPPLVRDITAEAYFVRGDDLYIYRQAEDCGPDEDRFEEVLIGKVRDIAKGTYAYYGRTVRPGSVGLGGGGDNGSGGSSGDGFSPSLAAAGIAGVGLGGLGSPMGGINADGSVPGSTTPEGAGGYNWA